MKKQKGMSLMEIIISCAIYAMVAMLIAETMTLVNTTMLATNQMNRRLSYEARFADNIITSDGGVGLNRRTVSYQIRYDNDRYVRVNPTAHDASMYSNTNANDARNIRTGDEYRTNFNDPQIVGTAYNSGIDYRFMSFEVLNRETGDAPDQFSVIVRIVPYFTFEDASKSELEKRNALNIWNSTVGNLSSIVATVPPRAGGGEPYPDFIDPATATFTGPIGTTDYGTEMRIMMQNGALSVDIDDPDTHFVEGKLTFQVIGSVSGHADLVWTDLTETYHQYVKLGASRRNATFYQGVLIEYSISDRAFYTYESFEDDSEIPAMPDYSLYT